MTKLGLFILVAIFVTISAKSEAHTNALFREHLFYTSFKPRLTKVTETFNELYTNTMELWEIASKYEKIVSSDTKMIVKTFRENVEKIKKQLYTMLKMNITVCDVLADTMMTDAINNTMHFGNFVYNNETAQMAYGKRIFKVNMDFSIDIVMSLDKMLKCAENDFNAACGKKAVMEADLAAAQSIEEMSMIKKNIDFMRASIEPSLHGFNKEKKLQDLRFELDRVLFTVKQCILEEIYQRKIAHPGVIKKLTEAFTGLPIGVQTIRESLSVKSERYGESKLII